MTGANLMTIFRASSIQKARRLVKNILINQKLYAAETFLCFPLCCYSPSYAWRLRLVTERETAAFAAAAAAAAAAALPTPSPALGSSSTSASASASASASGSGVLFLGRHAGMVASLASRFPHYAPACRLAARWAAAHLFSAYLPHEAVELLVAAAFIGSGGGAASPGGAPGSPMAGA